MLTWEMIKELTENPKKVFKVICEESKEETTVSIKYGEITTQGYQQLFTDDEWEEVKKPVSFTEAFKAFRNGRSIYVKGGELSSGKFTYYPNKYQFASFSEKDIADGEWYIEE